MEPIPPNTTNENKSDQHNDTPVKDKGDVIMDTMNLVVKSIGFEKETKRFLERMRDDIARDTARKQALSQYVRIFAGRDVDLTRLFVMEDKSRDFLHEVKIKNALAVVEDSIDMKTEIIDRFSKA